MSDPLHDFFWRWPKLAVFATFLAAIAIGLVVTGSLSALLGAGSALYFGAAAIFLWVAAIAWGIVLSNVGADGAEGRRFPLCFALWLFRPPPRGEVAAVDAQEPHDIRFGWLYLIAILPIAGLRAIQYARDRIPREGDIYSMKKEWPGEGWIVAEVAWSKGFRIALRPIQGFDRRPMAFRVELTSWPQTEVELDREEFSQLRPKLIWRGERSFWSPAPLHYSAPPAFGLFSRARTYDAISLAGRNVDRVQADPHAFDDSPLRD